MSRLYSDLRGWVPIPADPFGEGACGVVFRLPHEPAVLAKVVKPEERGDHFEVALDVIRASTAGLPHVCQMYEALRERPSGPAVGFLMAFEESRPLKAAVFPTLSSRVTFGAKVTGTFAELEERTLFYTDAHDENVRQRLSDGSPVLIDTDSTSFPEIVLADGTKYTRNFAKGAREWLAPEHWGVEHPVHTPQSNAHIAALHCWVALKKSHPAQMLDLDGAPLPLDGYLTRLEFGRFSSAKHARAVPANDGVRFEALTPRLQAMFATAFSVRGLRDPLNRPPTAEWAAVMAEWDDRLSKNRLIKAHRLAVRRTIRLTLGGAAATALGVLTVAALAGRSPPAPRSPVGSKAAAPIPTRHAVWQTLEPKK